MMTTVTEKIGGGKRKRKRDTAVEAVEDQDETIHVKSKRNTTIAPVEDPEKKNVRFSKRRKGLFNKAKTLATITHCKIAILVWSPGSRPFRCSEGPGNPSFDHIIDLYAANATVSAQDPTTSKQQNSSTFNKRRDGIFKKAAQLSILCSIPVGLVILPEFGRPYVFAAGPGNPSFDDILSGYALNYTRPMPNSRDQGEASSSSVTTVNTTSSPSSSYVTQQGTNNVANMQEEWDFDNIPWEELVALLGTPSSPDSFAHDLTTQGTSLLLTDTDQHFDDDGFQFETDDLLNLYDDSFQADPFLASHQCQGQQNYYFDDSYDELLGMCSFDNHVPCLADVMI